MLPCKQDKVSYSWSVWKGKRETSRSDIRGMWWTNHHHQQKRSGVRFESREPWLFEICLGQRCSKDSKQMIGKTKENIKKTFKSRFGWLRKEQLWFKIIGEFMVYWRRTTFRKVTGLKLHGSTWKQNKEQPETTYVLGWLNPLWVEKQYNQFI